MSEKEMVQQLRTMLDGIRSIGETIEAQSVKSDCEIRQTLQNGRELSNKYLSKPFNDSFNI